MSGSIKFLTIEEIVAIEFLLRNGYDLEATKEEAERMTLAVAAGELPKQEPAAFFALHFRPLASPK